MITSGKSSSSITSSTFTNSSAADGGVISTFSEPSFRIISSVFIQNRAIWHGGVMQAFGKSSFTITSSIFSNNTAVFRVESCNQTIVKNPHSI